MLADVFPEQDEGVSDTRRSWEALLGRRRLVMACVITGLLVAIVCNSFSPVYSAVAVVSVEEVSQDPLTRVASDVSRNRDMLNLNVEALSSSWLALDVVRSLEPRARADLAAGPLSTVLDQARAEWRTRFLPSPVLSDADAAQVLRSRVGVTARESSKWIEIKALAHDPQAAAAFANVLIDLYARKNEKWSQERAEAAARLVEATVEERQQQLGSQLSDVTSIASQAGVGNLEARRPLLQQQAQAALSALAQVQAERASTAASLQAIEQSEGRNTSSPLILASSNRVAELEERLDGLLTTFGDKHPDVQTTTRQLDSARRREAEARQGARQEAVARLKAASQEEARLQATILAAQTELATLDESSVAYSVSKQKAEATRAALNSLLVRRATSAPTSVEIQTIQTAAIPVSSLYPQKQRNYLLGLGLGLAVGVLLAWFLNGLDATIRSPHDVQMIAGLRVLGVVPRRNSAQEQPATRLVDLSDGFADGIRMVRASLMFGPLPNDGQPKVVVVTSATPEEGKSTLAVSLAALLTETGSRVLLVDADLRRPTCHVALGMGEDSGLAGFLSAPKTEEVVPRRSPVPRLDIVTAGPPQTQSAALLGSAPMKDFIARIRKGYDWVVIDSPPALVLPDASIVANMADGIVLVCRADVARRRDLASVSAHIRGLGGVILGAVLNDVDMVRHSYYYGRSYSTYYGTRSGKRVRLDSSDRPPQASPEPAVTKPATE